MGDFDDNKSKIVCNQPVLEAACLELYFSRVALLEAYNRASGLADRFKADYEGEAESEVMQFLEGLPIHIGRLIMLYSKMEQFITVTIQSLQNTDAKMVQTMEK